MQIMKDVGGVEMPEYFGKLMADAEAKGGKGGDEKSASRPPKDGGKPAN